MTYATALDRSWRLSGRWYYSLEERRSIESIAALEYQTCCWAVRTAMRRICSELQDEHTNSIHFELVMKGLGNAGDDIGRDLERDILYYSDPHN